MKIKIIPLATLLITSLLFTSCATIFSGTKQTVSFQSTPPDADVVTVMKNGTEITIGRTPCTVEIKKKTKDVKFVKQDYYTETYYLRANATINAWYWVDLTSMLFFGTGFVATAVDLIDGAYIKLPEQVKVELKKK
jgi:hypothetical protein